MSRIKIDFEELRLFKRAWLVVYCDHLVLQGFHGIIQCVSPSLQRLYSLLEVDFNPLVLCAQVEPLLEELNANEETQQYVEPLKEVTLVRLIKQVCETGLSEFIQRGSSQSL